MRDIVFVNGKFVSREEAVVPVEDRANQFGDGVYEVIRFHGRNPVRLDAHLVRLQQSCEHLRIHGNPSIPEWRQILSSLLDACEIGPNDPGVYCLYQQVSRGVAPRNHVFPAAGTPPGFHAYFRPAPRYTTEQRELGVSLKSHDDERWERCYIKSICLLPVVMAKQAAVEAGAFEALLVRDGKVTEGGATNAYCVRNGTIWTHPRGNHILSGVTRELVLQAAFRLGIPVREQAVTLPEFLSAEEAFLSSTTMDVLPVTRVDDAVIGSGRAGAVVGALYSEIQEILAGESAPLV